MKKILMISAAAILFSGCSTTDIVNTAQNARAAVITAKAAKEVKDAVAPPKTQSAKVSAQVSAQASESFKNFAPIKTQALSVPMRKSDGKTKIISYQPNIALVGYNIGAYTDATATGKASGDLLGYSQGSRTTIRMQTTGIDASMLRRVADAAHDDLASKLTQAGFNVVTAAQVASTPSASNLKFNPEGYSTKLTTDRGKKTVLVVGPTVSGAQSHLGIGKTSMGGNGIIKPSKELEAVMLMPNLVLDFAALSTQGGALTTRSSASANVRFAIDNNSGMNIQASKGRFVDGWLNYGIKKPVVADGDFAVLTETASKSNTLERGLGAALGMATASKKVKEAVVTIDPVRYEALAMNAAAGWNTAFVEQLKNVK